MKKKNRQSPLRDALHSYQLQSQGQYGRLSSRGGLADRYRRQALLPDGDSSDDDMMLEGEYDELDSIPDYLDDEEDDF